MVLAGKFPLIELRFFEMKEPLCEGKSCRPRRSQNGSIYKTAGRSAENTATIMKLIGLQIAVIIQENHSKSHIDIANHVTVNNPVSLFRETEAFQSHTTIL